MQTATETTRHMTAAASTNGTEVWLAREDGTDVVLTECRWYVERRDSAELDAFAESDDVVLTRGEERAIARAYADYLDEARFEAVMP